MNHGHHQRPSEVRVALDVFASGIPHQAVAFGQVAGIPHRDHLVVVEVVIADAVDEHAGVAARRPEQNREGGQCDQSPHPHVDRRQAPKSVARRVTGMTDNESARHDAAGATPYRVAAASDRSGDAVPAISHAHKTTSPRETTEKAERTGNRSATKS